MNWGDFIKGAVVIISRKYTLTKGIKGVIEGTLPIGGLSSSAAVIITYLNALCKANGITLTRPELINLAIGEERNYIGVNVGKLDQSCEVYCKSAAYALMAFGDMEYGKYNENYLRDVPYGIYEEHHHQLPQNWEKRAKHYYAEQKRVKEGVKAWRTGDLEKFGRLIFESGRSSIENYEAGQKN